MGTSAQIYFVFCTVSEKVYVGQTLKTLPRRWADHVRTSRGEQSGQAIHRALRKHGSEAFLLGLLETCHPGRADERERFWIEALDTLGGRHGYNMKISGKQGRFGAEARSKISRSQKARLSTLEGKEAHARGILKRSKNTQWLARQKTKAMNLDHSKLPQNQARLSSKQRAEIVERRLQGERARELASEFGVSTPTIYRYCRQAG